MTGTWSVASRIKDAVSMMTGLKETVKGVNFIYAKGSNVFYDAKMEEKRQCLVKYLTGIVDLKKHC